MNTVGEQSCKRLTDWARGIRWHEASSAACMAYAINEELSAIHLLELTRALGGGLTLSREDSSVYFLLPSDVLTTRMTTYHIYLSISQVGTIFNLVDSLACGIIGVLAIAESRQSSLDKALGALKFIRRMVSRLHSIADVMSAPFVLRTTQRLECYLPERNAENLNTTTTI